VRKDDVIAYDIYTAGQVVVKKGQTIDGKALAVLAALRDKKQMEDLVAKVESKQTGSGPIITDTKKFLAWVGAVGLVVLLMLWRWGGPRVRMEDSNPVQPVTEPPALLTTTNPDTENWRARALIAEQRAEQAHEAIRQGALGWMRERLFRSIFRQRADLLSTHQMAEAEMIELEQRMAKLLVPLQERIRTYEDRVRELEETLASQEGDSRHLIDARISRARHQLELERARAEQDF